MDTSPSLLAWTQPSSTTCTIAAWQEAASITSLPFAFPVTYLLLSSYMLSMSFARLIAGLFRLVTIVFVANPWIEHKPPPPLAPPDPDPDPTKFLPKGAQGNVPAKRLLHLALLAVLSTSDAIPELALCSNKQLKRDLRKYRTAKDIQYQTGSVVPPPNCSEILSVPSTEEG
jgi:hypothetical protein